MVFPFFTAVSQSSYFLLLPSTSVPGVKSMKFCSVAYAADNPQQHQQQQHSISSSTPTAFDSRPQSALFAATPSTSTPVPTSGGGYASFGNDAAAIADVGSKPMYRNQLHRESLSFPSIAFIDGNLVSVSPSEAQVASARLSSQKSMTALSLLQHSRSPSPSHTPSDHNPGLDSTHHHRIPSYSTDELADDFEANLSLSPSATTHAHRSDS